jgi:Tfp pilus assembly protein PilN
VNHEMPDYDHINFLPEWYISARRCRRSLQRQALLLLLMVAGMALLQMVTLSRRQDLSLYEQALAQQVSAVRGQLNEVADLQQTRTELAQQLHIYESLARPITFTQISNTLAALTPDAVFLTTLDAELQQLTRQRARPQTDPTTNKPKTESETYEVIQIEIEGVAPSNVEIANYVGQLAATNLFRNVKMIQSREGAIGTAVTRAFKLTMEVALDRAYRFQPSSEVANAH